MQNLYGYPKEAHEQIVNGGIMVYEFNKKFEKKVSLSSDEIKMEVENNNIIMLEREKNNKLDMAVTMLEKNNKELKEKLDEVEKKCIFERESYLKKEISIKTELYEGFEEKLRTKDDRLVSIREDTIKKEEAKHNYLKNELERERENKKTEVARMQEWLNTEKSNYEYLKKRYECDLEKEVANQTDAYKNEIVELRGKIQEYFNRYENKCKGKIFEEDFYKAVEEYNDKEEANKWKISHVGSKYGGMCDIIFQHKDTGLIILVESKNNLEKNPVPTKDVDKFYRDVLDVTNNAIGGIMISTSKIQKKRSYESEVVQNKKLLFISHFSLKNIGQLFCNLDHLVIEKQINNKGQSKEDRNDLLIKQYDFYMDEYNIHNTRSKKSMANAEEIREIYHKLNNEDIKIKKNNEKKGKKKKKKVEKVENEEKNEEKVEIHMNFEELEKNCDFIKKINNEKQTKFYLKYENEENATKLQYFSDNHKMRKKMEKIEKEGKKIIDHSPLKIKKIKEQSDTIIKIST